jgi:hypothetical protein
VPWTKPAYKPDEVDDAGRILASTDDDPDKSCLDIFDNWRSSHSFPLNTFSGTLRNIGKRLEIDCIVAQRLKRRVSVAKKLRLYPKLTLSSLQDIGGCRVILPDVECVSKFVQALHASSVRSILTKTDDYIVEPKKSGYRGVHVIYKYRGRVPGAYDGLLIEIQIRSQLQHVWATSVETTDMLTQQSIKNGAGEPEWTRFFVLMGSLFAMQENCRLVRGARMDRQSLNREIVSYSNNLGVYAVLSSYQALNRIRQLKAIVPGHFYLLRLQNSGMVIKTFAKTELNSALAAYAFSEAVGDNAVLVSVDDMGKLGRAYPNYFADTSTFLGLLRDEHDLARGSSGMRLSTE